MPTWISRFSSIDLPTPNWFFFTTNTYRRPPWASTAPRGTASTPSRSRELILTFTFVFGSSSSLSLFTEHSSSPTLLVPRATTCFGIISVFPAQLLFVDKRPDANFVQVRHLRQQVPQLYEIPFLCRL